MAPLHCRRPFNFCDEEKEKESPSEVVYGGDDGDEGLENLGRKAK